MPEGLAGQWCQTRKWTDQDGYDVGGFIKAKNFCKETRPVVFTIHQVGFWIKLANTKTQILCVPLKVEDLRYGWSVVADCGADDLSTGFYRLGFSFESDKMGGITIMRWTPTGDTTGDTPHTDTPPTTTTVDGKPVPENPNVHPVTPKDFPKGPTTPPSYRPNYAPARQ